MEDRLHQQITAKLILLFILIMYAKSVVFAAPVTEKKDTPFIQSKLLFSDVSHRSNSITTAESVETTVNVKYYLTPAPEILPSPTNFNPPPILASGNTVEMARSLAREAGINDDMFVCIIQKESGFNSRRVDGSLKCGDNGASCGLAQFQLPTWMSVRRHAGWSQEDLRADDYENLKTAAYGLKNGWKYHWTGYHVCASQGFTL